ncbi:MAG: DUF116 domain-containing protein [Candidatus Thermoplasmatota archaeon]
MKDLVRAVLDTGMDIGTRTALQRILSKLGFDIEIVDDLYIKLKNETNRDAFSKIPFGERILLLPQCLRSSQQCKAPLGDEGYECQSCGACIIAEVKKHAKDMGYAGVYVVPGGSMVMKIVKRRKPKAVLGIACNFELAEGAEKLGMMRIPCQGVPLLRDGCKDTLADIDQILEAMRRRAP